MVKSEITFAIAQGYEKNPVLRALVQLVPFGIGSALDTGLIIRLNNIRQERLKVFFDELGAGHLELSEQVIESEDFLHCYFATLKAVINTKRREKIQFLAHLLRGGIISDLILDVDEYEELLATLESISYREILMLDTIERHTPALIESYEPWQEDRCLKVWQLCKEDIVKMTSISPDEVRSAMRRLDRTGFIEFLFGSRNQIIDDAAATISQRYSRLKSIIHASDNRSGGRQSEDESSHTDDRNAPAR